MARALNVLADLSLALDDENIAIRGEGDRIIIDLPSLRAGQALLRAGPFSQGQRQAGFVKANAFLQETGLTIDVRYAGEVVGRLGAEARPSAVSRLLRISGVEVRPTPSLRAAVRRRPGLTLGVAAAVAALVSLILFWRSGDE
jgi:hypothetical protein